MQLDVEPSKLPSDVNSPREEYVDNGDDDNDNNNDNDNDDDDSKDPDYKGIDDDDKDNDDNNLDDDDGGGKCGPGEKPSMRVKPGHGLYYRDNDALLDEIFDDEYNEKHFKSIPSEAACDRNRKRPDNPSKSDERFYKRDRKAYTDNQRRKLMKTLASVEMNMSPQKEKQMTEYTGDQYPHIRLINFVEQNRLMTGHTFAKRRHSKFGLEKRLIFATSKLGCLRVARCNTSSPGIDFT
jgi:hypothetical protein